VEAIVPASPPKKPDTVAELLQQVRSHELKAARERLRGILSARDDILDPSANKARSAFFGADSNTLIGLMTAFHEEKDDEAAYWIVRYLFWRTSLTNDRIDQIVLLSKKLMENHFNQEMRRFAVERQRSLRGPRTFGDQNSVWALGDSAVVSYVLGDFGSARDSLRLASEELAKCSTDRYFFDVAIQLGHFFRMFDYGIAHTLFEIARSLTGKNPIESSRSAWYGELA